MPQVGDEEARQWRAWNLLYSVLHVRGLPMAELCHPLWNDFRRSVKNRSLSGVLMKATAAINHGHGPWRSGKRRVTLHQAAERLMAFADESYFDMLTERVMFDRGWSSGGRACTKQEFLESYAVTRRLPYDTRVTHSPSLFRW